MITYNELEELKNGNCKLVKELIEKMRDSNTQLNIIDMYAHAIKNVEKIIECEEKELAMNNYQNYAGGYSNGMYSNMIPQASWGYDYSGARGRGSNANRDSMGRYSSHGDMKEHLYKALENASTVMEKQQIQNLLNGMD